MKISPLSIAPIALLVLAVCGNAALAKLPPPDEAGKAKAAEAAAKAAHAGKVGAYQLCKTMDRVAASYLAEAKKAGKTVQATEATPSCADPGAFAYTPPAEAAGAHSPAATAVAPPSGQAPKSKPTPEKK